LACDNIKN